MEARFARPFGIALVCAFGLMLAACSSSPSGGTSPTASGSPASSATSPAASPAASGGLSGKWSGQYSGAFTGTFTLTWQQSGSNLSGHITLSSPPSTVPVNGSVQGTTIRFGTVGSAAITYSGSVSGSSMSGNYTVGGSSGGPWSASKTS